MGRTYKNWEAELKAEFKHEFRDISEIDFKRVLPVTLTRKECKMLIDYYSGDGVKDRRNKLIVRILYVTGIRISELSELRYVDIDYDTGIIFIRAGKGEKDRYVCADKNTLVLLKAFQENKPGNEQIFTVSVRQLRRIVEKAGKETGIADQYDDMDRKFSPHSLRHAFATHSYENGMKIFTLKKLMGHEFLGTTLIYVDTALNHDVVEYINHGPMYDEI